MSEQPPAKQASIHIFVQEKSYSVAPGSSVTIPLKLQHNGVEEGSFRLQISGLPADWVFLPQPVVALSPGDEKEITITIQPPHPPAGRAGNYQLSLELTNQEIPTDKTQLTIQLTMAAYAVQGEIGVLVESTHYTVAPGNSTTVRLVLRNQSMQEDSFESSIVGIPGEWITTSTPIKTLKADEEGELLFNIQPPQSPQGKAGRYPFVVRIFGQSTPGKVVEIGATLTVAAYEIKGRIGILMEATQYVVVPGSQLTIPVILLNQGLSRDGFEISVTGIPVNWVSLNTPTTILEPGEQKEFRFRIQPPRHSLSKAGRNSFKITITSQNSPEQKAEVKCVLTVGVYSEFTTELRPLRAQSGKTAQVIIENQGNIQQNFNIKCFGEGIRFEPADVQDVLVPAGEIRSIEFQVSPQNRQILGGEAVYPYAVTVKTSDKKEKQLNGEVTAKAWIPLWVIPVMLVLCLAITCASIYFVLQRQSDVSAASLATRTASANQTAAAVIGEEDSDGDGLTNREEQELGTDPINPDTDGDLLQDGPEVKRYQTNPLDPDSDSDGLNDGDEVSRGTDPLRADSDSDLLNDGEEVQRGTDPLIPDSDRDGLGDGDEVQRGTNPLNSDTDEDNLDDGPEVNIGTDPLNPDTDRDKLFDGQETMPCPDPLNPDTDGDSIIDGEDPDPCDPSNPSITASAIPPTETPLPPTVPPTTTPTGEPTQTVINIGPGTILFESNRVGNAELYSIDTQSFEVSRLTNEPAVDTQPVRSPDGGEIAFVSNRSGDFEIYVMNADGSDLRNISNTPLADDLDPAWSPDGGWIVFSTNRDGNQEIYTTQIDGPDIHNLSNNPESADYQPDWFESGGILFGNEQIVFTSERDGNPEVYRMNSDGSEPTRLTDNPAADSNPKGSPGGNQILFVSERDGNPEVYLMDVDGANPRNLTNHPGVDRYPTWRSNDEWIAYTSNRDANQEIYAQNLTSGQVFNITKNPAEDLYPSWK